MLFCHIFFQLLPLPCWCIPKTSCSLSPSLLACLFALLYVFCLAVQMWSSASQHWTSHVSCIPFYPSYLGERGPLLMLCFQTHSEMTFWHVARSWLCLTHGSAYCMRPWTILRYFSVSLSLPINLKQFYCKGKSFLPDLHLLCSLQKPLFPLAPHSMLHYLLLFYDFPSSTIINNCLFPLRNLKFLGNTMSMRSSIIQGNW